MDKILIKDLLVRCTLGVDADERRGTQDAIINIVLHTDLSKAGRSDKIEDATDYRSVKRRIIEMAEKSQCHLVEALAERVAEVCLENPDIIKVEVTVEKPGALRFARSVGVTIERGKDASPTIQ
jgi:D-erythro-7,8-dihydroneopterin triphosphate epimerase